MSKYWKQEPFEDHFNNDPFAPTRKEPYPYYFSKISPFGLEPKDFGKKQSPPVCIFCDAGLHCTKHGTKAQSSLKETPEKFGGYTADIYKNLKHLQLRPSLTRLYRLPNGEYCLRDTAKPLGFDILQFIFSNPDYANFFTKTLKFPPTQIGGVHLVRDVKDIEVGNYEAPTGANAYEVLGKVEQTPLTVPLLTGLEAVIFFEMK